MATTPPKTNPLFFSLPTGYFDWPEEQKRAWMEKQAAATIDKLKPGKS